MLWDSIENLMNLTVISKYLFYSIGGTNVRSEYPEITAAEPGYIGIFNV